MGKEINLNLGSTFTRKFKPSFKSFRMKKWSGGVLIMVLGVILVILYSTVRTLTGELVVYSIPSNQTVEFSEPEAAEPPPKPKPKPWLRPNLINVKGLSDLFSMKNTSQIVSTKLLVWDYMQVLLSRSDALPETAQGIEEAAIAFKNLVLAVKKEEAVASSNIVKKKDKNCLSSVHSGGEASLTGRHAIDIPCGLILDSSVSVVGIIDKGTRSFQIELLGSKLQNETRPPIILHYNVSLPGENMTNDLFIVQNTWTKELGWGKEDRCPHHGKAKITKVDELLLCNEQSVRIAKVGRRNVTHLSKDTTSEVGHLGVNFPFLEGNPFTATLWVGEEGFHMTVNGRHETSFAYRNKLEPWSVGRVRVSDDLNLLSIVATGLPIPDDHDLGFIEKLAAPSIFRKKILLLIGVFSTGNNFKRRMALRHSWMQYEAIRSGKVAVRFLIGFHKNTQVNLEMLKEAQTYGDVQFMPFVDYYGLISLKTVALCILGTKIIPAKYIMKTDDDAFVRIDEVLSSLKVRPATGLLYGLISFDSAPNREEDSKWYIREDDWPHETYPPWAHGPGYIISRDIAKFVVRGHLKRDLRLFKLEDVAMGIWVEEFNNTIHRVHYSNDERFHNIGCESNYILAHYQGPRLLLCLWEKLQKEHQPICCE